ncbi:MAG: HAMP domain-containing histidine kinase [Labilithrix sp.]|nr:HAMP domain-containing histidine kinase [Labilithrix sp.]MCW5816029.1 HAMP domain-containing histidine kinase [Labilithrix sp.]
MRLRARVEELERANQARDRVLAVLAHDLRAPLNAILGWTLRLQEEEMDEESEARALATIVRNANTQGRLIERLLDVARLAADRMQLMRAPIELGLVVDRVVEGFVPSAAEQTIELTSHALEGVVVMADRERIEQVVTNLVANAIKYTDADGHVKVRVDRERGQARITVSDDGQGIAPDLLPHVFDAFTQDASVRSAQKGLGLGLHIVKHLVDLHGGTVVAASGGVGAGATFTVRLPLHEGSVSGTRDRVRVP